MLKQNNLGQQSEFLPFEIIFCFHRMTWAGRLSASILQCVQQRIVQWRSIAHERPHPLGLSNWYRRTVVQLPSQLEHNRLVLTNVPVDKFGFANLHVCSLKHNPQTIQLSLLTRESFTVSKGNMREQEVALYSRIFSNHLFIFIQCPCSALNASKQKSWAIPS